MKRAITQRLLTKSNVARGNWTSPVHILLPYGVLAVNQQDNKTRFYKDYHNRILQTHINQCFTFSNHYKKVIK